MTVPGRFAVCACLISAGAAVACGSSFSPSSTSGNSGAIKGAPSGAVITGTVSGMGLASMSPTEGLAASATSKPVTVTVVGTNISSVIDGSGKFRLENVPAGDVILRFTATGLDATLMLRGVEAGDRIDIKVRVTDTSVRIDAERRESDHDDGDDDEDDEDDDDEDDDNDNVEDELTGTVSNLTGTCPTLTFTMNGTTVRTNSATDFDVACGQIANGTRIEVEGTRQFDGSLLAAEVERDDD